MDTAEAKTVLANELARYRRNSYAELQRLLTEQDHLDILAPSGTTYQIKIHAVWDDHRGGTLRVFGEVDDGGWRAFVPLSEDFLIRPDGRFVGE